MRGPSVCRRTPKRRSPARPRCRDRWGRRTDHRGRERGRVARTGRHRDCARPERPKHRRDEDTSGRRERHPPSAARGYARDARDPRKTATDPGLRRFDGTGDRLHGLDRRRPLHRVMDRRRLLAPEVVGSDRSGLGHVPLIEALAARPRRTWPEWNELLPRTKPVPREVDDVGRRVYFFPAGVIMRSVVFHRFADLFRWAADCASSQAGSIRLELAPVCLN